MTTLSDRLSGQAVALLTSHEVATWLDEVANEVGGVKWLALGAIPNNVHTVEVASDPALALVERPINGIDALLDLTARERDETAPTPHEGARRWWGVPSGGLAKMPQLDRATLAGHLRVTMSESGDGGRPTITVQDAGTGQHPDDFASTLLSLLASNKKTKNHQMGVYNAGGAASCRFARYTIIASRLAPSLLDGRADEVGITVIRYNALDPDRYKSGTYEYFVASDDSILRLDAPDLQAAAAAVESTADPKASESETMAHGTFIRLIEYQLSRYARAAHEPKQSLWHLFHAALPDPPLPFRIVETRDDRFSGVRGVERRTVAGLLHLLGRKGVADYADVRPINLGPDVGTITLRYYVLNEGSDPDAYTTTDQGLTITNNGQRQITKDRAWVKRHVGLPFLFRRLVAFVDGTDLTNATKREVFSSTRETGVDSPTAKQILDRVTRELIDDENLHQLDELARQRVLEDATKSTSDKVKRQLATQIGAYLRGELSGSRGGRGRSRPGRRRDPVTPPSVDDSQMLDIPDRLALVDGELTVEPGRTAALRLEINAKNDFLPTHGDGLSIVFDSELDDKVRVRSTGRLLGGRVRVTLEADPDAPIRRATLQVALVVPKLGVLLTTSGVVEVVEPQLDEPEGGPSGGEPNIDVQWIGREKWDRFDPSWDAETVGVCNIFREDLTDQRAITKVEWILNEAFKPYERVTAEKRLTEATARTFKEGYEYPVLFGLFRQQLAREATEATADDEGDPASAIPERYSRGEQARMARAVLMALEPELAAAGYAEAP
ncbi:MAG TPA: hypothetical protein VGL54_11495 [Solirubrobacteraceae bacterium]|jgi:hypothetical protein